MAWHHEQNGRVALMIYECLHIKNRPTQTRGAPERRTLAKFEEGWSRREEGNYNNNMLSLKGLDTNETL